MSPAAKRTLAVLSLALGIVMSGLLWFNEVKLSVPPYANAAVPAPGAGQKKIVLKNLGMA